MTDSDAESVKSGNGGSKANKKGDNVKKGDKSATSGGGMGGANVQAHRNTPDRGLQDGASRKGMTKNAATV